jgi:hypothetical protein
MHGSSKSQLPQDKNLKKEKETIAEAQAVHGVASQSRASALLTCFQSPKTRDRHARAVYEKWRDYK